jgi:dihydrolipoamide dehydrogenase
MSKNYNIAVLGGGPGGYVAAIRAAQLGLKTVIVEKDNLGGVCLNWGCIPTKSLLKNAEIYDLLKNRPDEFGLTVDGLQYDFKKIIKRSRDVSTRVSRGVDYLMKKNKIDRIKGFGKFISPGELEILDGKGKAAETVRADKIIIATGARARQLPTIPVDGKRIITSTEAMILPEQPEEMVIIGAGAIGVEFAYFYNVLGTKVTIVEMMDRLVPVEDKEVSEALKKSFSKRGIKIHTSSKVEKAEVKKDKVILTVDEKGKKIEIKTDIVLNAIGVVGNVENIGLEEIGVEVEKNHIKVDKSNYGTNLENIYAIGDVIGAPWLAHVASAEGITCVEKIAGLEVPDVDYESIPGCTYCHPQVASIGMTEEQAREAGYELKIGKFPFSASGKATAAGEREGFVKLLFDEKYGELLGAHIIGAEATELIAELGIAKSMEATFESIVKTVHAHPTLSESVMEAAANAYGESIHI